MRTSLDLSLRAARKTCASNWNRSLILAALATIGLAGAARAESFSSDGIWHNVDAPSAGQRSGMPWVRPNKFQGAVLDNAMLEQWLHAAPLEGSAEAESNPLYISLPTPDGAYQLFRIVDAPVMEPGLAAQFPDIKTYAGQGVDDPAATVRLDNTPLGFHAQVLSPGGNYYIDPYTRGDNGFYASYYKRDLDDRHGFSCLHDPDDQNLNIPVLAENPADGGGLRASGSILHTYRLALACTGEYGQFFGGTVANAQAAIVTAVNRVTGVYESECGIRLTLVANNSSVVYTSGGSDPYTNTVGSSLLTQNNNNLNSVIGSTNYDMGHVFATGDGGIAALGVVCKSTKGQGATGSPSPVGDAYYIDYVAHEMGHQFGANHNFNSTSGSCGGGNRNGITAYEVGSASTIMGYAGICGADNLQPNSDPYFSADSYAEILAYTASSSIGGTCDAETNTGNTPPIVEAGPNYTIPRQTPFALTATGNDPNGDAVTYLWEQRDLGSSQNSSGGIFADNGTSPFLRTWTPTVSPTRTIPRLSNLLSNNFAIGEQFPNSNRTLHFRCTARDNRLGGGGVNFDDMTVTVTTAAGPFQVTSPNTAVNWTGSQTVTWNVASTTASPVSCANVSIALSTDGGNTFPTVLVASTPNDGSEVVTLPSTATTSARIRVAAVGNIFFDISNTNFTITAGVAPQITGHPSNQSTCSGGSIQFTCSASGSPTPTIQWRKGTTNLNNTGNISGATSTTLTINPVGVGDAAANYNCVATNSSSSATSNDASLTVNVAASVSVDPNDEQLCSGDGPATFSVVATGTPAPTYRWRKGTTDLNNGSGISGVTTNTLTIDPVSAAHVAANYNCVVTNSCGSDTSLNAALIVDSAPQLVVPPAYQDLVINDVAVFTVAASGSGTLEYQWYKNGNSLSDGGNINGSTTATLTIDPVGPSDAGNYSVEVSNSCDSTTSTAAGLWQRGDLDHNSTVDSSDAMIFGDCLTGPGVATLEGCEPADIDADGDVDLADFAMVASFLPVE